MYSYAKECDLIYDLLRTLSRPGSPKVTRDHINLNRDLRWIQDIAIKENRQEILERLEFAGLI